MNDDRDIFGRPLKNRPAHMNTFLRLDEPKTKKQIEKESGYTNVNGHVDALVKEGKVVSRGRGLGYVINKEWFEKQPESARRAFLASCGIEHPAVNNPSTAPSNKTTSAKKSDRPFIGDDDLRKAESNLVDTGYFNPADLTDAREKVATEVVKRSGQPKFKRELLKAYDGKCAVTGCDAESALEAAHIIPYCGDDSDHVSNGMLLRADIHTLFDLGLLRIHPETLKVRLSQELQNTTYSVCNGQQIVVPADSGARPNAEALRQRWHGPNA
ncbi:MAG: HNH endonuclease [Planctomycetaceae bacterium]